MRPIPHHRIYLVPLLAAALSLLGTPGATATEGFVLRYRPQPADHLIVTASTRTESLLKRPGQNRPVRFFDVITHTLEVETDAQRDALGMLRVRAYLTDSRAQTLVGTLQPMQRRSPLADLVGAIVTLTATPTGELQIEGAELPDRKLGLQEREQLLAVVREALVPLPGGSGPFTLDRYRTGSEHRRIPIDRIAVPVEVLHRYKLLEPPKDGKVRLQHQSVIRPLRRRQAQQAYGKGEGEWLFDTTLGLFRWRSDRSHVEARLRAPGGEVIFASDTRQEIMVVRPSEARQRLTAPGNGRKE